MLHRVPLHIRVSPETRQRLQLLRTERHLNVGSWLRALIDEALEEQQTTNGGEAEKGKAGGCTQPDISDGQHRQRGTPLDSLGLRVDTRLTCPPVTVRSSRGLDLLRVCPLCRPSNRRSVPLPSPPGLGAECGDETRGVGTIWSVRQPCRGVSRLASTLGWPVRGVVQPLRWWLSGDTDAMWLDRCGEDDDRPFFHGLTEQLRPPTS